jgi:hypothetical protein
MHFLAEAGKGRCREMAHQSGIKHLAKHFVKPLLCLSIGLGCWGIGTNALAYQDVYNAQIISFRCLSRNTCTLTINKDHPWTRDGTAACVKRVFAWNPTQKPYILGVVRQAYSSRRLVGLRYSEYRCYDARGEGGAQYMALGDIWLQ